MASKSFSKSDDPSDEVSPSSDYAEYLTNTTLFHLGSTYHLFEKKKFMSRLNQFYDPTAFDKEGLQLWHVQFLLVIAFGKLFLGQGASTFGPPGAIEFRRAMKELPDITGLYEDPILGIEILCLVALYFLSADMRNAAYAYVCFTPRPYCSMLT
jgi:hypothetical protein